MPRDHSNSPFFAKTRFHGIVHIYGGPTELRLAAALFLPAGIMEDHVETAVVGSFSCSIDYSANAGFMGSENRPEPSLSGKD